MSIFKNTPWMNATIEKPVNRGNIKFTPGQEVLAHYVPAKYKSGKMVRPEGYEVYSNRIYKSKTHTFALINFLFIVSSTVCLTIPSLIEMNRLALLLALLCIVMFLSN